MGEKESAGDVCTGSSDCLQIFGHSAVADDLPMIDRENRSQPRRELYCAGLWQGKCLSQALPLQREAEQWAVGGKRLALLERFEPRLDLQGAGFDFGIHAVQS